MGSFSTTYGGPFTPADPVDALEPVVRWLHHQHSAKTGIASAGPARSQIEATFKRAAAAAEAADAAAAAGGAGDAAATGGRKRRRKG